MIACRLEVDDRSRSAETERCGGETSRSAIADSTRTKSEAKKAATVELHVLRTESALDDKNEAKLQEVFKILNEA